MSKLRRSLITSLPRYRRCHPSPSSFPVCQCVLGAPSSTQAFSNDDDKPLAKPFFKNIMETTGGKKAFIAEKKLIEAVDSKAFPPLEGENLLSSNVSFPRDLLGKVSLVCVSLKQYGFLQLDSWITPFEQHAEALGQEQARNQNPFQVWRVCLSEGFVAYLLKGSMMQGLKAQLPVERHSRTMVRIGEVASVNGPLSIDNDFLGYVFLVDATGKIRWKGCGEALPDEIESLRTLMKDVQQKK